MRERGEDGRLCRLVLRWRALYNWMLLEEWIGGVCEPRRRLRHHLRIHALSMHLVLALNLSLLVVLLDLRHQLIKLGILSNRVKLLMLNGCWQLVIVLSIVGSHLNFNLRRLLPQLLQPLLKRWCFGLLGRAWLLKCLHLLHVLHLLLSFEVLLDHRGLRHGWIVHHHLRLLVQGHLPSNYRCWLPSGIL